MKSYFARALALMVLTAAAQTAEAETVLRRGNGTEPETLDVHKSSGVPEANIQRDLFEGLVMEGPDGALLPGAAKDWEISDDGRVYTFRLRNDSRWSDGRPVTAHDFVYAYRRALDPATASDYAFILWPIANAEAVSKGEVTDTKLIGAVALDDRTLRLTLKAPTPYFLGMLTHHMGFPVPRHAIEAHGRRWTRPGNMVSNGAYRLAEWVPQSHLRLVRNEHYRGRERIAIDAVLYYPTESASSELKRFRAGELDITATIPVGQRRWARRTMPEAYHSEPYLGTNYYAFNVTDTPFKDNAKLRRALAMAIDREILAEKVLQGDPVPAYAWVPPGVRDYAPQPMAFKALSRAEREARARDLYAESGHRPESPLNVELLYNTSETNKKVAVAIAAMWKKVLGVRVSMVNQEWKVYLDSRARLAFQVARAGWIGDYNDANTFLELFKSDVGEMNPSGYVNSEYDGLMKAAETTIDPMKRADLMQRAERIMLSDMPIVPLFYATSQHLVSPRVKGWIDNVMDVHPTRTLSLAE